MLELKIDNKQKKINVNMLLKGETEPIEINITKYDIEKENGETKLCIKNGSSSRPWIDAILKNVVIDQKFNVPPKAVDFLNQFLG